MRRRVRAGFESEAPKSGAIFMEGFQNVRFLKSFKNVDTLWKKYPECNGPPSVLLGKAHTPTSTCSIHVQSSLLI